MGFFDWFKGLFQKKPITRSTVRLDETSTDADPKEEVIAEGGPWKPQRLRLALRDRRLLPKDKPKGYIPGYTKKKVMPREEAVRLFAGTLRTKNRSIRDLLPDLEQLRRYGLPEWKTEAELAGALGITVPRLRSFSVHRPREKTAHYYSFAIPKRSGGERLIRAPKRGLKAVQRKIHQALLAKLPVSGAAHGFIRGRSIKTGALPHQRPALLLKLDLQEFFPTLSYARIRGYLIAMGYGYPVASTLAVLMTESERQPVALDGVTYQVPVGPRILVQGAPTSPGIANAICHRLDRRLLGLAKKHGLVYTRYADDLSFSSPDAALNAKRFLGQVRRIVESEGFSLNAKKTRIMRRSSAQKVTGVTVNDGLGLSRTERRKLRAMKHRLDRLGAAAPKTEREILAGKLAYLAMLNPAQAAAIQQPKKK